MIKTKFHTGFIATLLSMSALSISCGSGASQDKQQNDSTEAACADKYAECPKDITAEKEDSVVPYVKYCKALEVPYVKEETRIFDIAPNGKILQNKLFAQPIVIKVGKKDNHKGFISIDTITFNIDKENQYSIEFLLGEHTHQYGDPKEYDGYYNDDMFIYDRIIIHHNGKYITTFQNQTAEGWEGFLARYDIDEWQKIKSEGKADRINRQCKIINLDKDTHLLCFTGQLFPSSVPTLTIFVVRGEQIEVVYHGETVINKINDNKDGTVEFECASCYSEYESEDKYIFNGYYFNIYTKDSHLYIIGK